MTELTENNSLKSKNGVWSSPLSIKSLSPSAPIKSDHGTIKNSSFIDQVSGMKFNFSFNVFWVWVETWICEELSLFEILGLSKSGVLKVIFELDTELEENNERDTFVFKFLKFLLTII